MGIEHKTAVAALLSADDEHGVIEALVSVTGIEDQVGDVIIPGAYGKSLTKRMPRGVLAHQWDRWVSRAESVEELLPGDPRLPAQTKDGKTWPPEAGALHVKARFALATDDGRNAYEALKFFAEGSDGGLEWSIGYKVPPGKATRDQKGVRHIKELDLYEFSPVLFGAAPQTTTLAIKALMEAKDGSPDGEDVRELQHSLVTDAEDDAIEDGSETVTAQDTEVEEAAGVEAEDDSIEDSVAVEDDDPDDDELQGMFAEVLADPKAVAEIEAAAAHAPEVKVAGREVTPGDVASTERLKRYWSHGKGAAKIGGWGHAGDFASCVRNVRKFMPKPGSAEGYCSNRHHDATGAWPGHAPGEHRGKKDGGVLLDGNVGSPPAWSGAFTNSTAFAWAPVQTKDYPRLDGSWEEHLDEIREAVEHALLPDKGIGSSGSDPSPVFVSIEATFDSYVIASRTDYGKQSERETFRFYYRRDPDGKVTLEPPESVDLTVTVAPPKEAPDDSAPADGEDYAVSAALSDQMMLDTTAGALKALFDDPEVKAGRVLSTANMSALRAAVEKLIAVLASAGVAVGGEIPQQTTDAAGVVGAKAFDSATHPRAKAGAATGGQFIKAGDGGDKTNADEQDQIKAVEKELGLTVDGKFDAADSEALKKWQAKQGIQVDGVVGKQTVTKMRAGGDAAPGAMGDAEHSWLKQRAKDQASPVGAAARTRAAAKSVDADEIETLLLLSQGLTTWAEVKGIESVAARTD